MSQVSFNNTEIAFGHKSDKDLRQAKWLFSFFNYKFLIRLGPPVAVFCLKLKLPIKGLIRNTIFKHFCGGESIEKCRETAKMLYQSGIGSILDYSVEGMDKEASFDLNYQEIRKTIDASLDKDEYPFAVFKTTGIGRMALLEKAQSGAELNSIELVEFGRVKERFYGLCNYAAERDVKLFVDAEDSWIQDVIDDLTVEMMKKHNTTRAVIYNTLQMYRHDRLGYLKDQIELAETGGYYLGFKLVRGAYMEKERARAADLGYPSPIQKTKAETDADYDEAIQVCFAKRDKVAICVGTHNEVSSHVLVNLMLAEKIDVDDDRFWFAQLFGMSDNISFNLSHEGFNVAKYLPYGPIEAVMPYLGRRAVENSSVAGQVGREMNLIVKEQNRRKALIV